MKTKLLRTTLLTLLMSGMICGIAGFGTQTAFAADDYEIIHQPTVEEPYVEVNEDEDATYQWYEWDADALTEIVEEDEEKGICLYYDDVYYEEGKGWYESNGYVLNLYPKKDYTLKIVPSAVYEIGIYNYTEGEYLVLKTVNAGEALTCELKADINYEIRTSYVDDVTDVTLKIYLPEWKAMEGETKAELENPVIGNSYMCEVTVGDEVLESDVVSYAYEITHQPTIGEPYVEVNKEEGATYQWYKAELTEIVEKDEENGIFLYNDEVYYEDGWYGYDFGNGADFLYFEPTENYPISIVPSAICYVGIWDNDAYDNLVGEVVNAGETITCELTAGGAYNLYINYVDTDEVTLKISLPEWKAMEGETKAELENPVFGNSYMCEVTVGGVVLESDVLNYGYGITHQPTVEEPYVEVNEDEGTTYQWYEDKSTEIVEEDEENGIYLYSGVYYEENVGWHGSDFGNGAGFLDLEPTENYTIAIIPSATTEIDVYNNNTDDSVVWEIVNAGEMIICELTAGGSYDLDIYYVDTDEVTLKIFIYEEPQKLEGQNTATLTSVSKAGDYYVVVTFEDGTEETSEVLVVSEHVHNWVYTVEGATITATCEGNLIPCDLEAQTLTILAPEGLGYDGNKKEASVKSTYYGAFKDVEIVYDGDWTSAGTHTATVTYGGVTASLEVTITPQKVIVTVNDAEVEQYVELPTFTYEVSGFIGEDTLLTAPQITVNTDGKTAGEFEITASGATASTNYVIEYVLGTLTVTEHTNHRGGTETCEEKAVCDLCEEGYGEVLGHTEETVTGKAATCTETGLTDGVKCSVCGETLTAQTEIPAKGHSYGEWTVTKEATATEDGSKEKVCSVCSDKVTETIPATGTPVIPDDSSSAGFDDSSATSTPDDSSSAGNGDDSSFDDQNAGSGCGGCNGSFTIGSMGGIALIGMAVGFLFKKKED